MIQRLKNAKIYKEMYGKVERLQPILLFMSCVQKALRSWHHRIPTSMAKEVNMFQVCPLSSWLVGSSSLKIKVSRAFVFTSKRKRILGLTRKHAYVNLTSRIKSLAAVTKSVHFFMLSYMLSLAVFFLLFYLIYKLLLLLLLLIFNENGPDAVISKRESERKIPKKLFSLLL